MGSSALDVVRSSSRLKKHLFQEKVLETTDNSTSSKEKTKESKVNLVTVESHLRPECVLHVHTCSLCGRGMLCLHSCMCVRLLCVKKLIGQAASMALQLCLCDHVSVTEHEALCP